MRLDISGSSVTILCALATSALSVSGCGSAPVNCGSPNSMVLACRGALPASAVAAASMPSLDRSDVTCSRHTPSASRTTSTAPSARPRDTPSPSTSTAAVVRRRWAASACTLG